MSSIPSASCLMVPSVSSASYVIYRAAFHHELDARLNRGCPPCGSVADHVSGRNTIPLLQCATRAAQSLLCALRCSTHEIAWPGCVGQGLAVDAWPGRVGQGLAGAWYRRGLVGRGTASTAQQVRAGYQGGGGNQAIALSIFPSTIGRDLCMALCLDRPPAQSAKATEARSPDLGALSPQSPCRPNKNAAVADDARADGAGGFLPTERGGG